MWVLLSGFCYAEGDEDESWCNEECVIWELENDGGVENIGDEGVVRRMMKLRGYAWLKDGWVDD